MPDLRSALSALPPKRAAAPWPGYEHVKGWGVFALPFDSGHVLALRVFPENDFAPYRSLWHRDPSGRWSIYVDGPRLDTACPRYFGAACVSTELAPIDVRWTGRATVQVTMQQPAVEWTLTARSTPVLDVLNAVGRAMPLATWRVPLLIRAREVLAASLGLGDLQMSGAMPSGHMGTLMPEQMFFVDDAHARFDGVDLGRPTRFRENPRIGASTLPARGILAIGRGMWVIRDDAEYREAVRRASETHAG